MASGTPLLFVTFPQLAVYQFFWGVGATRHHQFKTHMKTLDAQLEAKLFNAATAMYFMARERRVTLHGNCAVILKTAIKIFSRFN